MTPLDISKTERRSKFDMNMQGLYWLCSMGPRFINLYCDFESNQTRLSSTSNCVYLFNELKVN